MPFSRWSSPRWSSIAIGVAIALIVTACSNATNNGVTGISVQDPQLVTQGANLYQASCAECHGSDVRGTDRGPSFLSDVYEPGHHSDVAFLLAVQRGSAAHHWKFGDMLPIDGLTTDDVDAIVAFVRETQRIEGFE